MSDIVHLSFKVCNDLLCKYFRMVQRITVGQGDVSSALGMQDCWNDLDGTGIVVYPLSYLKVVKHQNIFSVYLKWKYLPPCYKSKQNFIADLVVLGFVVDIEFLLWNGMLTYLSSSSAVGQESPKEELQIRLVHRGVGELRVDHSCYFWHTCKNEFLVLIILIIHKTAS